MMSAAAFAISSAAAGQTLAAILRAQCGEMSWSEARRLIQGRRVRVNGSVCQDDARRLKEGETVELLADGKAPASAESGVRIVHRDTDLIVVDKPAGLQTVRRIEERDWSLRRKERQPVLQEIVQKMIDSSASGIRVRAVHRLDRDTSGLTLFALSERAERELVRLFASHKIRRRYRAVVVGALREARTIQSMLVRDRGDGIRGSAASTPPPPDARLAITRVRPIRNVKSVGTLVECELETGRTHQIRIHLAEIGHRVCGEKIYLRPRPGAAVQSDPSAAKRQALHSFQMEFTHPLTGKEMKFESPWPRDLAELLTSRTRPAG